MAREKNTIAWVDGKDGEAACGKIINELPLTNGLARGNKNPMAPASSQLKKTAAAPSKNIHQ